MASRSIDFAKTASIDMMTLNNKVVNMRQVVKRTKVHVISKLCKHITALKKKKGTDEQKAKNLRKAQRFIEEIDSIKKLKEDKVSKYALANTVSFSETSKTSLSSGPRALARLADHHLMKKIVLDFRQQHSDWRDLSAYLLIKQTGRRFKTKKQKQKKLDKCAENIHASETMTKTYIQERFGQEGLAKAELRFEQKRKRPKSAAKSGKLDADKNESERQITANVDSHGKIIEDLVKSQLKKQLSQKDGSILEDTITARDNQIQADRMMKDNLIEEGESNSENSDGSEKGDNKVISNLSSHSRNSRKVQHKGSDESSSTDDSSGNPVSQVNSDSSEHSVSKVKADSSGHSVSKVKADSSGHSVSKVKVIADSVNQISNLDKGNDIIAKGKTKRRNECVVKQLKLVAADDDSSDGDDSAEGESEDDASEESSSSSSNGETENMDTGSKHKESVKKQVPEFLTNENKTKVSDKFFVGSDDDDDDGGVGLDDNEIADIYNSEDDMPGGKFKAKSMFYNQSSRGNSKWSHGESGRRGGFERRGGPGRFDRGGQRGRTFRNDGHGRGSSISGAGRGGKFGDFNRKSAQRNHASNVINKEFIRDRSNNRNFTELGTGQGTHQGVNLDKRASEKLHPSWEASKKRKAEQSGITAFKGSKITFVDDD